ncbi:hypothetical protein A2U01_0019239, partial [Trifolium medium]|nr:hypothetical protein [Trifolium medium]
SLLDCQRDGCRGNEIYQGSADLNSFINTEHNPIIGHTLVVIDGGIVPKRFIHMGDKKRKRAMDCPEQAGGGKR